MGYRPWGREDSDTTKRRSTRVRVLQTTLAQQGASRS